MRARIEDAVALAGFYCQDGVTRFVEEVSNGFQISPSSGRWRVMDVQSDIPCISVLNTETQFHYTITHTQIRNELRGVV
jgi:hypothetical protein